MQRIPWNPEAIQGKILGLNLAALDMGENFLSVWNRRDVTVAVGLLANGKLADDVIHPVEKPAVAGSTAASRAGAPKRGPPARGSRGSARTLVYEGTVEGRDDRLVVRFEPRAHAFHDVLGPRACRLKRGHWAGPDADGEGAGGTRQPPPANLSPSDRGDPSVTQVTMPDPVPGC